MKVLAFGEILWDIIDHDEHLGGAPFNFAAHSAQCGNDAYMISRIGDDVRGIQAYNRCTTFGVKNVLIQWDQTRPTGTVLVKLTDGQPDYTIVEDVAYDYIAAPDLHPYEPFDVFYFGSLAQRSATSRSTLNSILSAHQFRQIFYDVNLRKGGYTENIIRQSLSRCSIFKLNIDEVPVITNLLFGIRSTPEELCRALTVSFPGITLVIVTAADKGCYVYENGTFTHCAGRAVEVKDAVGAGDAFSAAFMHVYVQSGNAIAAAKIANEVGAFVTTQPGAIPVYSSAIKRIMGIQE